jgi:hypothetical protein
LSFKDYLKDPHHFHPAQNAGQLFQDRLDAEFYAISAPTLPALNIESIQAEITQLLNQINEDTNLSKTKSVNIERNKIQNCPAW